MASRAHRRLRLPADDRTPAVARAAVRQVLLAGGRADQLDEALLLVSELSTNGVVHAGTPLDVDVLADENGVTITVSDQRTGLVGRPGGPCSGPFDLVTGGAGNGALNDEQESGRADLVVVPDPVWDDTIELQDGGRGLLLVDRLASSWGTSHHAEGKSVWFRLGPGTGDPALPVRPLELLANSVDLEQQQAVRLSELPVAPGIEFGGVYAPAGTGEVGGDFYDVFAVRRNRWFVSIGGSCGKGTRAAVVTGVVRAVMRVLVGEDRPVGRMLASLNRTLLSNAHDRYATVAVAMVTRLESPTRARVLEVALCLAGRDRPILVGADGTTRAVGECGTALGLVEQFEVSEVVVTLRQGESLVFVTDGVTERRDGTRRYGTPRLRHLLSGMAGQPAQVMAGQIQQEVLRFAAEPPREDIAVLVLRNPG